VLAGRRAEVDRLNVACQRLLAARSRLGPDRLQVEDRQLAVGDRVVCGRNTIAQLGVANGTRGTVTALDPQARTLTIRPDGKDAREVTLPGWYLDGRQRSERNRRVDLAYATTGHRAQGLTRWRALVRITGYEDTNWLYVQLSRARHQTTLYPVVGPEPQGPAELDLPDRETGDGYDQLARALSRAGGQTLAIDTSSNLDLRRLSVAELRAERDRLQRLLDQAPRNRERELARATARRAEADQALEQLTTKGDGPQRQRAGMLRLRRQEEATGVAAGAVVVARQQADRAAEVELALRRHQQRRAGWLEANAHLGPPPTAKSCGNWPGSAAPPAWPPNTTHSATFARNSDPSQGPLGVGGRGGRRPPPSRTTAAPMGSATPTRRSGRCRASWPSGPPGTRPAPPPSASGSGSGVPAVRSGPQPPARDPLTVASTTKPASHSSRQRAGLAPSGPPASSSRSRPCPGPTPPSPTRTRTAPGRHATRSSQACPSGPSATLTSRPCSPTSTTTTGTSAC
jgi:hypothetical protein